jgi:hypothetical protein
MPLSPVCFYMMNTYSHRNQIYQVGRHQEVRRFVSPGLQYITSNQSAAIARCPAMKICVDFAGAQLVSSEPGDDHLPSARLGPISKDD